MCRNATDIALELEHLGLPFSRNDNGAIYQRAFGGHMQEYGKHPAQIACTAADRTGHPLVHTVYQQCLNHSVDFYIEYFAIDPIMEDGACRSGPR